MVEEAVLFWRKESENGLERLPAEQLRHIIAESDHISAVVDSTEGLLKPEDMERVTAGNSTSATAKMRGSVAPYFIVDDVVVTANFYRDKLGTPVPGCAEESKILLSAERGSDSFKKGFEVGGTNSHLYKKVKVRPSPGVRGNLGFKNHAALRGVFFSSLPRTYVLGYFLSLLRSSEFDRERYRPELLPRLGEVRSPLRDFRLWQRFLFLHSPA